MLHRINLIILICCTILCISCKTYNNSIDENQSPKSYKIKTDSLEWKLSISPNAKYLITGSGHIKKSLVNFRNKKGEVLWNYRLADSHSLETSAISKNGRYAVLGTSIIRLVMKDGKKVISKDRLSDVIVLNKRGKPLWKKHLYGEIQVNITEKGDKIFAIGSYDNILYCFNSKGDTLFKTEINNRGYSIWGIRLSEKSNTILIDTTSDIILLDLNGNVKKHFDVALGNIVGQTFLSNDGKYIAHVQSDDGKHMVVLADINYNILWKKEIGHANIDFDDNNNIYISSRYGGIKVFNPKGQLVNYFTTSETLAVKVKPNGKTVYVKTRDSLEVFTFSKKEMFKN
jgi:hypothetical protein